MGSELALPMHTYSTPGILRRMMSLQDAGETMAEPCSRFMEGVVDIFPEMHGVKVDKYLLVAVCVWIGEGPGALGELKAGVVSCIGGVAVKAD